MKGQYFLICKELSEKIDIYKIMINTICNTTFFLPLRYLILSNILLNKP